MEIKTRKQNGNEIKKNRKEIETINMSFKRLLIFPFQYLAELKENLLSVCST